MQITHTIEITQENTEILSGKNGCFLEKRTENRQNDCSFYLRHQDIALIHPNLLGDMSFPLTPSKRPFDRNPFDANGRGKWQKSMSSSSQHPLLNVSPGTTVLRVLCPASKSGGVIGKGGGVIMQIRQETGVKVKVEDTIHGCDERIIIIVGSDKDVDGNHEQNKEADEEDKEEADEEDKKEADEFNNATDEGDDVKENIENANDKEITPVEDSKSEKPISPAQKALLLVFERMVEGGVEADEGDEEGKKSLVIGRLLVFSSQVGCLLGKGGSVIKQMAAESGALIRILPKDKLPLCASQSDELVQITGELDAVRKAIILVSQLLMDNPPRDRDSFSTSKPTGPRDSFSTSKPTGSRDSFSTSKPTGPRDSFSTGKSTGPLSHRFGPLLPQPDVYPPANHHFPIQGAPYAAGPHRGSDFHLPKFHESVIPGQMNISEEVLTFRLLCTDEKVGGVIGKGGSKIKTLKLETGCDIKILEGVPDSDDRIIVISGPVHPDDRIAAAQDAVLRVQSKTVAAGPDSREKTLVSRLLVSSSQIGCLLGKGGAIIAEMRKISRANIRILGKDQIPACASENEEVVHITGDFEAVQEALLQITTRLRHHLFRDKFPAMNHPPRTAFPDQVPSSLFPPYAGRRGASPTRMYSNFGAPFLTFDTVGGLPSHDERSSFLHGIHRPGFPPHGSERIPSSVPWGPQGMTDGGGPNGVSDYAGAPQRRIGGFGGGSQPAVITNTTVEVVVPRPLVPSIVGEDGCCLKQIRQISGAKITITDPKPGTSETLIIISGTPEETHAAQSLLQAFVMSETTSP